MKKLITLLLAFALSLTALTACTPNDPTDTKIQFYAPSGAPILAAIPFLNHTSIGGLAVTSEVVSGTEVVAKVTSGEANVAIMPTNTAAIAYNRGADIKLVSVNVSGILYMVGRSQITSLNDLRGKVVYNIGQGATPDAVFRYILEYNDIPYEVGSTVTDSTKVYLSYVSEGADLIGLLNLGNADYGIMGEPMVTKANTLNGISTILDLQSEWQKATGYETYPQASLVMSAKLAEDRALVDEIIDLLTQNDGYIRTNTSEVASKLTEVRAPFPVPLSSELIDRCAISTVKATDAKASIVNYLTVLHSMNPQFVGGKLPDDDFYYV